MWDPDEEKRLQDEAEAILNPPANSTLGGGSRVIEINSKEDIFADEMFSNKDLRKSKYSRNSRHYSTLEVETRSKRSRYDRGKRSRNERRYDSQHSRR